jgi:ABC-type multidrug transport system fused ATPase/permease subunit
MTSFKFNTAEVKKIIFVAGKENLLRYAALGMLMLCTAVLEAFGVGIVVPFLAAFAKSDVLLAHKSVSSVFAFLGIPKTELAAVFFFGILMLVATVFKGVISFWANHKQARLLYEERAYIARRLFEHYLNLPYCLHLNKNIAALIHATVGETTNFATVYMTALMTISSELMVVLSLVVLLFLVSPTVTLVACGFIVLMGGLYGVATRVRTMRLGREQHHLIVAANKCLIEGLSALKETRVFGAAAHFLRRFDLLSVQYTASAVRMQVYGQIPKLMIEAVFICGVVGSVMFLAWSHQDLKTVLPTLALFGMAFMRLMPSYNRLLLSLTSLRMNQTALNVLYGELKETVEHQVGAQQPPTLDSPLKFNNVLSLQNVSYRYPGADQLSVRDVSLSVGKGLSVALVGKSGSGKTTLVDMILGLLTPLCGELRVDDVLISGSEMLHGLMGYIPQSIYLTDDTLRRNIAFGIDDEAIDESAVQRAIEAAQLKSFIDGLPDGLDTMVGDRGVRLSGGQRQRVGIARALYADPPILVLDEATSALDAETEAAVTDAIHSLGRHKTLIVIAHRLSTVRECDALYLVDQGRIVDCGTYQDLAERSEWFGTIAEKSS